MLEQPWPPPGSGRQQPRDAHRQHWANDARVLPGPRARSTASDLCGPAAGREPAVRRRAHDAHGADRPGRDGHGDDAHGHDDPAQGDAGRAHPLAARWVPAEAWIPDPTPAPDDRWTPERDWVAAFAEPRQPAAAAVTARPRARRWLVAAAVVVGAALLALAVTIV